MLFSFSLKKDRGVEKRLVVAFNLYVNIVRYNGVNQKACSMKSHFPNVLFSKSSAVARLLRRVGGKGGGWLCWVLPPWFCILFSCKIEESWP